MITSDALSLLQHVTQINNMDMNGDQMLTTLVLWGSVKVVNPIVVKYNLAHCLTMGR